ncbi:MAG: right-handed parallel beta-helix repeat-containing protein [Planctomycetota bacterium]
MRSRVVLSTTVLLAVAASALATTRLVPSQYPTIQAAVDDCKDADEVVVAPGTYTGEGNRDIDFLGKAITVRSVAPQNPHIVAATIIDCNGTATNRYRGFYFHSGEDIDSVVDGLTITGGYAPGPAAPAYGGGICCMNSSPEIRNCAIIGNCASIYGGGIGCHYSSARIANCLIKANTTGEDFDFGSGAAIYARHGTPTISGSAIVGNTANGGGTTIYYRSHNRRSNTLTVTNCLISNNAGGAIHLRDCGATIAECILRENVSNGTGGIHAREAFVVVANCVISNNKGGGIYCMYADLELSNSILSYNYSVADGGGLSCIWEGDVSIKNCVFLRNSAQDRGGGIWIAQGSSDVGVISCTNCTLIGNVAGDLGGGLCLWGKGYIGNCILWDNNAPTGPQVSLYPDVVISYSDIQGGRSGIGPGAHASENWGRGNIDQDPRFSLEGDYHILDDSPCIDRGTNSPPGGLPATDMYGNPRTLDGDGDGSVLADMGAYEYAYNSQTSVIAIDQEYLDYYALVGERNPVEQWIKIRNCGGGTLNWQIVHHSSWLQAVPERGRSTGEIDQIALQVDTAGLPFGEYASEVTIFDANALNDPRKVLVKLHVAAHVLVPQDFPTIQSAIDAVADGSTVTVRDGVYRGEGNTNVSFKGKTITVRSQNGPGRCVIDCENRNTGYIFDSHEQRGSVVDGFTITDGNSLLPYDYGGAILCLSAGPTVENCRIFDCEANRGGGIFSWRGSPLISNCTIMYNWARAAGSVGLGDGGGICCIGGRPTILDSVICCNNCVREGGGIYLEVRTANMAGCTVNRNYAERGGGGMRTGGGSLLVRDSYISANEAPINAAAIYSIGTRLVASNCVVAGNKTTGPGSTIWAGYLSSEPPEIVNCTIYGNMAASGPALYAGVNGWGPPAENPEIVNTILRNYCQQEIIHDPGDTGTQVHVEYANIRGGWAGGGNIDADPCFVEPCVG